jgi:hypothetical protein
LTPARETNWWELSHVVVRDRRYEPPRATHGSRKRLLRTRWRRRAPVARTLELDELDELDDVIFDADTGVPEDLLIGARRVHAGSLLGSGSYAAVLDETQEHSP